MTTDFRALCAELLNVFDSYDDQSNLAGIFDEMKANKIDLIERARAALADEPAVPEGREPGAADLETEFRFWWKETYGSPYFGAVPLVAVLAWTEYALARWGNPAPTPPADGEVAELVADMRQQANHGYCEFISRDDLRRAAELLQRQVTVPEVGE